MRDLLEFLARALVSDPEAVEVTEVEEIDGEVVRARRARFDVLAERIRACA